MTLFTLFNKYIASSVGPYMTADNTTIKADRSPLPTADGYAGQVAAIFLLFGENGTYFSRTDFGAGLTVINATADNATIKADTIRGTADGKYVVA